jgi:tellurium resistance protein TerD|nr:MAG TPA: TerD-like protein [Bacteriophage sp.]
MITLSKGGRVDLSKESSASVFRIGLGWDAAQPGKEFDLDAMALMLNANGKAVNEDSIVFYRNLEDPAKSVKHSGDNRTGDGNGDDEVITIDTTKVPADVQEILVLVNIHDAKARQQNFGMVKNAKVNLYEGAEGNNVLAKYDLEEDASMDRALVFCKLYRKDGAWKFQAVNEGKGNYQSVILRDILRSYGYTVEDSPAI